MFAVTLRWILSALLLSLVHSGNALAQTCSPPDRSATLELPGKPFSVVSTSDRCWLFVSMAMDKGQGGVAVLHNEAGEFKLQRTYDFAGETYGEALAEDVDLLAVAAENGVLVLDLSKLKTAAGDPLLGTLSDGKDAGYMEVAISYDRGTLFASEEQLQRIGVFDLTLAKAHAFHASGTVGHIPTGVAPVGLSLSPDGNALYAVSEVSPPALKMPSICKAEDGKSANTHPQGLLLRIDPAKAISDPLKSIVDAVPAGCNPVRVVVSPDDSHVWVTARGDDALIRFATEDLQAGNKNIQVDRLPVGPSPIGLTMGSTTGQVWVAISNRFHKTGDTGIVGVPADGASGQLNKVQLKGYPREVAFLHDTDLLVVTLYAEKQLALVPVGPSNH